MEKLFDKQLVICVKRMNTKDKRSIFEIGWSDVKGEVSLHEINAKFT